MTTGRINQVNCDTSPSLRACDLHTNVAAPHDTKWPSRTTYCLYRIHRLVLSLRTHGEYYTSPITYTATTPALMRQLAHVYMSIAEHGLLDSRSFSEHVNSRTSYSATSCCAAGRYHLSILLTQQGLPAH